MTGNASRGWAFSSPAACSLSVGTFLYLFTYRGVFAFTALTITLLKPWHPPGLLRFWSQIWTDPSIWRRP
nr:MAG TPA: hypothetical protein [Caudoviricetes sp.]